MATYNVLSAHTGTATGQAMKADDNLYVQASGSLNSTEHDGAMSTGGDNDLQINGTLAGSISAFAGADGDDLIQIYSGANVLGGDVSAITVGGTGDNTFINDSTVSTHSTATGVLVVELDGGHNSFTNHADGSITSAQDGTGVYINGGSNTFTNAGSITAGTDGASFASGDAVKIADGGDEGNLQDITNSGHMTALNGEALFVGGGSNDVSNSGVMHGSSTGVEIEGGDNTFTNSKGAMITGDSGTGVYLGDGDNHVHNQGSITGGGATGLYIDDGDNNIYNASGGHITGEGSGDGHDGVKADGGDNTLYNDGGIVGASTGVAFEGSSNTLTNAVHGHITGQGGYDTGVYTSGGDNTLSNRGHVIGGEDGNGVSFGEGDNTVHNYAGAYIQDNAGSYEDTGSAALEAKGGTNTITNSGHIVMHLGNDFEESENQAVYLRGEHNVITNTAQGVISDGVSGDTDNSAIFMSGGSNVVTNEGNITGTVVLGENNDGDTFNGASGFFNGTIYGGSGVDSITLGRGTATVYGGDGADFLGAGPASAHDTFDYTDVSNSYASGSGHFDTVDGFNTAKDSFNFALFDNDFFDSADFKTVTSAALTDSNFDADLAADVGTSLKANSAVMLDITGGEYQGDHFLIVDGNGQAGFQSGTGGDYVIEMTNISGTVGASDIHSFTV